MWHARFDPLRTAIIVATCSLGVVACGGTVPSPATSAPNNSSATTPTASALSAPIATPPGPTPWPFPGHPENCGPVVIAQDGNVSPAVCPDGRPNVGAITFFAKIPSKLLSLGPDAAAAEVLSAACQDLNAPAPNAGTIPLVTTEASLAFAENNWNFGSATSPAQINQQMVAGMCNQTAAPGS
jgi:hypothetical protein